MLLVLAIMVLAVMTYLLYSNFISADTTLSSERCKTTAISECVSCTLSLSEEQAKRCAFDRERPDGTDTPLAVCENQGDLKTISGKIDCTKYLPSGRR